MFCEHYYPADYKKMGATSEKMVAPGVNYADLVAGVHRSDTLGDFLAQFR